MNYKLNTRINPITNQQLLDDLLFTASSAGEKTISYQRYKQTGTFYPSIFTRRFGSWNNALTLAGLLVTKQFNVSAAQLLENIQYLWSSLNRQPTLSDLHKPQSSFGRKPYLRTFGTWGAALKTFIDWNKKNSNAHKNFDNAQLASIPDLQHTSHSPRKKAKAPLYTATGINWRLRHLIMKRDNFRCKTCGASPAIGHKVILHIDHIIPSSKGGTADPSNLQTLCSICNIGKSNLL